MSNFFLSVSPHERGVECDQRLVVQTEVGLSDESTVALRLRVRLHVQEQHQSIQICRFQCMHGKLI